MKDLQRGIWVLCVAVFVGGCNSSVSVPEAGHYQGTLIESRAGSLLSQPVTSQISLVEGGAASIEIIPAASSPLDQAGVILTSSLIIQMSQISTDSLSISVPGVLSDATPLQSSGGCFISSDGLNIRFCPADRSLTLDINDKSGSPLLSLTLDYFPGSSPPVLEKPASFSLDGVMQRAFTMEFNTREEFENAMRARHQVEEAYLNLIPHLSANSIYAAATSGTVVGMLASIGDLAPFLLPSRWLQAQEQGDLADAETDSLILMRGDAGVQAEGLAYSDDLDQQMTSFYNAALVQIADVVARTRAGEASGRFPPGTADQFAAIQIGMESDADGLDLSQREQRVYMAQALGFINPDAVAGVTVPPPQTPIDQAKDLNETDFQEVVLNRSYELRQMDSLIAAAQIEKTSVYFSWLDPQGDPTLGLGVGLVGAVDVENDKLSELDIARQQVQSTILQTLATTIDDYNDSLDDHARSEQDLALEQERVSREITALHSGGQVNILDLVTALPALLEAQINVANTNTVYRMSLAKLNRLTLNGYYARIGSTAGGVVPVLP